MHRYLTCQKSQHLYLVCDGQDGQVGAGRGHGSNGGPEGHGQFQVSFIDKLSTSTKSEPTGEEEREVIQDQPGGW